MDGAAQGDCPQCAADDAHVQFTNRTLLPRLLARIWIGSGITRRRAFEAAEEAERMLRDEDQERRRTKNSSYGEYLMAMHRSFIVLQT